MSVSDGRQDAVITVFYLVQLPILMFGYLYAYGVLRRAKLSKYENFAIAV
jgi:hypothetical protein